MVVEGQPSWSGDLVAGGPNRGCGSRKMKSNRGRPAYRTKAAWFQDGNVILKTHSFLFRVLRWPRTASLQSSSNNVRFVQGGHSPDLPHCPARRPRTKPVPTLRIPLFMGICTGIMISAHWARLFSDCQCRFALLGLQALDGIAHAPNIVSVEHANALIPRFVRQIHAESGLYESKLRRHRGA
ncbi:hypothetical protein SCHPADRAFT_976180 [Schizopora paradoxa]|uniref:Uncharacterized protein n=1 Tax=Schizopora paradoxa TaxID=27342 RepID=A0A0H2RNH6_9AGAM|nr:hypothetical protein SCHPADRAFT_976180 [Schizopora paradoxa]